MVTSIKAYIFFTLQLPFEAPHKAAHFSRQWIQIMSTFATMIFIIRIQRGGVTSDAFCLPMVIRSPRFPSPMYFAERGGGMKRSMIALLLLVGLYLLTRSN